MKPFSPLYFIKENKLRCVLLIFMIFLGYAIYLGGLYITNLLDNWKTPIEYYDKIVTVNSEKDDKNHEDFELFKTEVSESGKATVLEINTFNGLNWNSILGLENGQYTFTFRSVEDFKTYCNYMDIKCDFSNLKSGSMIMSDMFAKNKDLKIDDKIDKDYDTNIYNEFCLDAVTQEDGYTLYFITDEVDTSDCVMLIPKGISGKEIYDYAYELQDKYTLDVYDGLREEIESQFGVLMVIYMFIVILLAVIMSVTINAAFVGMYQRRTFEFAVYRAIGISRRQIIGKIVGELLYMDIIALVIGGGIFFLSLYLFNNIVLYPIGMYLRYFHPWALLGLLLCNAMIVVPLILSRCRKLLKADICEY